MMRNEREIDMKNEMNVLIANIKKDYYDCSRFNLKKKNLINMKF